jgi:citrate synthase
MSNSSLSGVIAGSTQLAHLDSSSGRIFYRGYCLEQILPEKSFLEVCYLLWEGRWPNAKELNEFAEKERGYRAVSARMNRFVADYAPSMPPKDFMPACITLLRSDWVAQVEAGRAPPVDEKIFLLSQLSQLTALMFRIRTGGRASTRGGLGSISENFLAECGFEPTAETVNSFDKIRIIYAEHGFNAATFTCRIVASTQNDLFAAVSAGAGCLKGALHGGAIEELAHHFSAGLTPETVKPYLEKIFSEKKLLMGFGHRVYRGRPDPRFKLMREALAGVSPDSGASLAIVDTMVAEAARLKDLHPNLDLAAGPAFHLLGFPKEFFLPLILISRVAGLAAHYDESRAEGKIIRPLSEYAGRVHESL